MYAIVLKTIKNVHIFNIWQTIKVADKSYEYHEL